MKNIFDLVKKLVGKPATVVVELAEGPVRLNKEIVELLEKTKHHPMITAQCLVSPKTGNRVYHFRHKSCTHPFRTHIYDSNGNLLQDIRSSSTDKYLITRTPLGIEMLKKAGVKKPYPYQLVESGDWTTNDCHEGIKEIIFSDACDLSGKPVQPKFRNGQMEVMQLFAHGEARIKTTITKPFGTIESNTKRNSNCKRISPFRKSLGNIQI